MTIKTLLAAALVAASALSPACADEASTGVTVPASLAQSIYGYLTQGGPSAYGQRLAEDLQEVAAAPAREKALRKRIEDEIKAGKKSDAGPAETAPAAPAEVAPH
jgi:hypothetical protein